MSLESRFWEKVNKSGPVPIFRPDLGPCWIWTAYCLPNGYGQCGRHNYAHRVSYELCIGLIPDGLELDHLCRVRHCVNPTHLEPVTHIENCWRGLGGVVSGEQMRAKTHCPQGHSYAGDNLYRYLDGRRSCRICNRDNMRRYRVARSAA